MFNLPRFLMLTVLTLVSFQVHGVQLKIATLTPEGSGWMEAMRAGAKEIKERTEGRVIIKLYGGGTQGSDKTVLRLMRVGKLQGATFTGSGLIDRFPTIQLYSLPMVFKSLDEVDYVRERMDDTLMEEMRLVGLIGFGIAEGGFARMMSSSPVREPADLSGKKVWVPEGDTSSHDAMKAMGLSPVALPLTDVMIGLQTGLIDVVTNSAVGAIVLQWHTRVKYIMQLPLVYVIGFLVIEEKAFDRLTAGDREIVSEVMKRVYEEFDETNRKDDAEASRALIEQGLVEIEPYQEHIDDWRNAVMESNRALAEKGVVDLELFNRMMAYLAEYRAQKGDGSALADAGTAAAVDRSE
ncbi:MAG: TRAP transporter substrate-binding protein DctP [Gammaproteobacteria bacterium]|nr:TRAP transporter substrate-binding protein DctP [Gammaproteobacteria bacterium]MCZ6879749.1 TRAP transporter substrate-binding protein DctP [Gammaproteobacteria bacterium]TDJ10470.1 MAG: C4-dicarboxylate ABC transporter [Gammaproteobacteria bacterium]